MNLLELHTGLNACTNCQLCYASCPVAVSPGYARAPLLSTLVAAFGSRWDLETVADSISFCVDCRACQTVCPYDVPVPAIMGWIRGELARREQLTEAQAAALDQVRTSGFYSAVAGLPTEPPQPFSTAHQAPAEILYHPGEATVALRPAMATAFERIMAHIGQPFQVLPELEKGCGSALRQWDQADEATALARQRAEAIHGSGAKLVITDSPACYRALAPEYSRLVPGQDLTVLHTSEYLAQLLDDGLLTPAPLDSRPVIYHDSCYLGRHMGVFDAPRRVVAACTAQPPVELPLNREETPCCGAGEGLGFMHRLEFEPAGRRLLEQAALAGAEVLISASAACLDFLPGGELETLSLTELVAGCLV